MKRTKGKTPGGKRKTFIVNDIGGVVLYVNLKWEQRKITLNFGNC